MKAEELRAAADSMKDPEARRGMLNAAASYDAMADDAEARQEESPGGRSTRKPLAGA